MGGKPLRVLFIVQGEGRGHLSQALALRETLEDAGHAVVGVLVGGSERRPLPPYFAEAMGMEPLLFPSLLTVSGRDRAGVSIPRTFVQNVRRYPRYRDAVLRVRERIREADADVVVNFYDALGGLAVAGLGYPPMLSVGHQYLLGHSGAPRPPRRPLELLPFRVLNRLSAPPSALRLALSFRDLADGPTPETRVVPPLLRRRVLEARPETGEHIVVYVVNDGYGDEVARWHERHPEVVIHGFWDRPGAPEVEEVRPNLTFHRLSDTRFLEALRTCRAFVGTAGFESVAEALWLGKPVMVVPIGNQVEQAWNAREAEAAGAGIARNRFDLSPLIEYLPRHRDASGIFRAWVRRGQRRILTLIEERAAEGAGHRVRLDGAAKASGATALP